MKEFILVGADPANKRAEHPGGQLTASEGLIRFSELHGFNLEVIDTTQSSFPVPQKRVRILRGLARVKQLNQMLSDKRYNGVIIFSSSGLSFYERILMAGLCRIRGVQSMLFVRSGHFINSVNSSKSIAFLSKILLKVPSMIGAQGNPWIDFYKSLGVSESRLCLVRNWISFDFPVAQRRVKFVQARLKFIFVGWLVEAKGVPQLLGAIEILKNKYDFELTLVGGGTLEKQVSERSKLDLKGYLNVLGWQDKKQVLKLLADSDVFILPSVAEGFPNALLEAMASGLPAITTDVGAISDSVSDNVNGFLLRDSNPERIAEAMEAYIKDPKLVERHSQKTLKIFEHQHGWEANCSYLFSQFSE